MNQHQFLEPNLFTDLILNTIEQTQEAREKSKARKTKLVINFYESQSSDIKLLCLGTKHVYNIENQIIKEIKENFDTYKPDLVLVEGWFDLKDNETYKAKIRKSSLEKFDNPVEIESITKQRGELGYAVMLASYNNIQIETLEPYWPLLKKDLMSSFEKEEFFLAQVIINLGIAYNRIKQNKKDFDLRKSYENIATNIKMWMNDENFDYSYEHFLELKDKLLGQEFDISNQDEIISYTKPYQNQRNIIDKVFTFESTLRDRVMFNVIKENLESGKYRRIMIVSGGLHVLSQEPALQKLFESI